MLKYMQKKYKVSNVITDITDIAELIFYKVSAKSEHMSYLPVPNPTTSKIKH